VEDVKPAKKAKASTKKAASAAAAGGSGAFSGKTFCISGKFSLSQQEVKDLITSNGGTVAPTPNKTCDYLVADSIGSSKTMKAQKDGLAIVTEAFLTDSVSSGKIQTDKKVHALILNCVLFTIQVNSHLFDADLTCCNFFSSCSVPQYFL
jgi:L-cysteine desulfidase